MSRKNYKPGQLITKSIMGHNYVLRLTKGKPYESTCNECVVPKIDSRPIPIYFRACCQWCMSHLGVKFHFKNP
jgi:hypothetical protein